MCRKVPVKMIRYLFTISAHSAHSRDALKAPRDINSRPAPKDGDRCPLRVSRERVMSAYRFYTIGRDDHIVGPANVIDCQDDQAAVESAQQSLNGLAIEIWDKARLVAHIDPPF
jgi:hypothetical protein